MNDSVDINSAAERLTTAVKSLEGALGSVVSRIGQLEKTAKEAESFDTDRAELARRLDQAEARTADFDEREADFQAREAAFEARQAAFEAREKEFESLAAETRRELDRVIDQVRDALGQD